MFCECRGLSKHPETPYDSCVAFYRHAIPNHESGRLREPFRRSPRCMKLAVARQNASNTSSEPAASVFRAEHRTRLHNVTTIATSTTSRIRIQLMQRREMNGGRRGRCGCYGDPRRDSGNCTAPPGHPRPTVRPFQANGTPKRGLRLGTASRSPHLTSDL
jgi:hypothetical protein